MHKDCQSNEPFLRQQFRRQVTMNVYYIDVQNLTVKLNFQSWNISLLHTSKLCIPDYRRKKPRRRQQQTRNFLHNFQLWQKKERLSWLKEEMHATSVYLCLQSPNNMCQEGIQIFRVLWDYYIYCKSWTIERFIFFKNILIVWHTSKQALNAY